MAVISVTIEESEIQLVSGIPRSITLTPNIPATIFFTLDGTDPTAVSPVAVGDIELPTSSPSVILKFFATDGVTPCPIITRVFAPSISILRQSHDRVNDLATCPPNANQKFPYGDAGPQLPAQFSSFGPQNLIVDKSTSANVFDGYDGTATGTASGGTDLPLEQYLIKFSERNALGERGRGIGTLPAEIIKQIEQAPPQSSNMNDPFFDARAMVIFQDSSEEPFDPNLLQINRQFFSLENPEKIKDGILLNTTAIEGLAPTGSFVRSYFNPRDNTTTYYYHDSQTLRWIISKEPTTPKPASQGLFNIMFSSRKRGARFVYQWVPFKGSRLI